MALLLLEPVAAAVLVIGAAFAQIGSWGLLRLDPCLKRRHGPSKAMPLGVGCVLRASSLWLAVQGPGSGHGALIALFLFQTARCRPMCWSGRFCRSTPGCGRRNRRRGRR